MLEPIPNPADPTPVEVPDVLPVKPPPKVGDAAAAAIFAWLVIIVTAWLAVTRPWGGPALVEGDWKNRIQTLVIQLQTRWVLGFESLGLVPMTPKDRVQLQEVMSKLFNDGSLDERMRFVVLAGELAGPAEAEKLATKLWTERFWGVGQGPQGRTLFLLRSLYRDYARNDWNAPSLDEDDRALLEKQLGWFGELALHPANGPDQAGRAAALAPAQNTAIVIMVLMLVLGIAFLGGCFGGVLMAVLWMVGVVRNKVQTGSLFGGVYAETFAFWMILYTALQVLAAHGPERTRFLLPAGAGFASLLALLWPLLRGVGWAQLCQEIGWTSGRGAIREACLGPVCYALTLPLLAVGAVVMFVLMVLHGLLPREAFARTDSFIALDLPAHPLVEVITRPNWEVRFQILFLGCVAAPIVEETMFRGVLHAHLREASAWCRTFFSVVFSALVGGFLFAAIHPQGWMAIPVLMAMAFGFSLAREWRGTLLPGIVMHGLNNGLAMSLAIVLLGD